MVEFKACPRCHGDLDTREDPFGQYTECFQCGYVAYTERERRTNYSIGEKPKPGRPRKRNGKGNAARLDEMPPARWC